MRTTAKELYENTMNFLIIAFQLFGMAIMALIVLVAYINYVE